MIDFIRLDEAACERATLTDHFKREWPVLVPRDEANAQAFFACDPMRARLLSGTTCAGLHRDACERKTPFNPCARCPAGKARAELITISPSRKRRAFNHITQEQIANAVEEAPMREHTQTATVEPSQQPSTTAPAPAATKAATASKSAPKAKAASAKKLTLVDLHQTYLSIGPCRQADAVQHLGTSAGWVSKWTRALVEQGALRRNESRLYEAVEDASIDLPKPAQNSAYVVVCEQLEISPNRGTGAVTAKIGELQHYNACLAEACEALDCGPEDLPERVRQTASAEALNRQHLATIADLDIEVRRLRAGFASAWVRYDELTRESALGDAAAHRMREALAELAELHGFTNPPPGSWYPGGDWTPSNIVARARARRDRLEALAKSEARAVVQARQAQPEVGADPGASAMVIMRELLGLEESAHFGDVVEVIGAREKAEIEQSVVARELRTELKQAHADNDALCVENAKLRASLQAMLRLISEVAGVANTLTAAGA